MKRIRFAVGAWVPILLAAAWAHAGRPAPKADDDHIPIPKGVEDRVRAVVPKGWTVATKEDTLVVRRDAPSRFINRINLPGIKGDSAEARRKYYEDFGFTRNFEFALRFRRRVTQEEYDRWRAENDRSNKKRGEMTETLRKRGIGHKFDEFAPSTPEEKRLVAEYVRAVAALPYHTLPGLFAEGYSVNLSRLLLDPVSIGFRDETERKECSEVYHRVWTLFTPYKHDPAGE